MSKHTPRRSARNETAFCSAFLDGVWRDFPESRRTDFNRIVDILTKSCDRNSSIVVGDLQVLCGLLLDYPTHIRQYAASFLPAPRRLQLLEDFHFSSIFEYTDQDGTTRRFAGFGLDSGESDYRDSNIYRFIMYVLAHPQSEDVLFSLLQFDVLRVLQILDDLVNNVRGSWTTFVQQYLTKYRVDISNLKYWRVRRLKCQLQARSGNIAGLWKTVTLDPRQTPQESGPFLVYRGRISGVLGQNVLVTKPSRTNRSTLREVAQVLLEQCVFWSYLKHPNILPLIGMDSGLASPIIKRDLVEDSQSLRNRAKALVDKGKRTPAGDWIPQILEGLNYLHTQGIVHGLLSGSNVMITSRGNVVLTDFGMYFLPEALSLGHWDCIPAPEVVRVMRSSSYRNGVLPIALLRPPVDIYDFATVCVEAFTGKCAIFCENCWRYRNDAFGQISELPHSDSFRKRGCPALPDTNIAIPELMLYEMRRCWSERGEDRPTASELCRGMGPIFR